VLARLAERARQLRLIRGFRQSEVAARAGVSLGTVARFEHTGQASAENVLRIAMALGAENGFDRLFEPPKYRSLDEALARPAAVQRKRVRARK
jgi:transcriptional regulator with XRE-family HTH domain